MKIVWGSGGSKDNDWRLKCVNIDSEGYFGDDVRADWLLGEEKKGMCDWLNVSPRFICWNPNPQEMGPLGYD